MSSQWPLLQEGACVLLFAIVSTLPVFLTLGSHLGFVPDLVPGALEIIIIYVNVFLKETYLIRARALL